MSEEELYEYLWDKVKEKHIVNMILDMRDQMEVAEKQKKVVKEIKRNVIYTTEDRDDIIFGLDTETKIGIMNNRKMFKLVRYYGSTLVMRNNGGGFQTMTNQVSLMVNSLVYSTDLKTRGEFSTYVPCRANDEDSELIYKHDEIYMSRTKTPYRPLL